MRTEPFAAHPLVIVAPPGHPLLALDHVPVSALAPYRFIVREADSGTRAAMEAFFRQHRIEMQVAMEMPSNETIKQAVIANMGLALLSLHTAGLEIATGQLVVLDVVGLPLVRRWHIVNIRGKPLSPAAEALRYFVLEQGESLIAAQFAGIVPAEAAA